MPTNFALYSAVMTVDTIVRTNLHVGFRNHTDIVIRDGHSRAPSNTVMSGPFIPFNLKSQIATTKPRVAIAARALMFAVNVPAHHLVEK